MASLRVAFATDAKELTKGLLSLPMKVRKKVMRPALKAGAKVVLPTALANAPVGKTRRLISSIRIKPAAKASVLRKGIVAMSIETGKGAPGFTGEGFYGAFQEFGWRSGKRIGRYDRWTVRNDRYGGPIPGVHYLERAFEEKKTQASAVVLRMLKAGLERAASQKGG